MSGVVEFWLATSARAAVVVLVALVATRLLGRRSAASRHLVWTACVGVVLALPLLSVTLPPLAFDAPFVAPERSPAAPALREPALAGGAGFTTSAAEGVLAASPAATFSPLDVASSSAGDFAAAAASPAGGSSEPAEGTAVPPTPTPSPLPWRALALAVYLGISSALLLWLAFGIWQVRRLGRAARPADAALAVRAAAAAGRLGIRRPVTVLLGEPYAMPMTWGWWRPRVLLPETATGWSEERLDAVLLHELAHVARGDYLTQIGAEVACALHWANPLVWLAAARLRVERELACDDQVLNAGRRATEYASQLLHIARGMRTRTATSMAAMAMARPSQLEGRLLAVLDEGRDRRVVRRRQLVLALGVAVALALPLASASPQRPAPPEPPEPPTPMEPAPGMPELPPLPPPGAPLAPEPGMPPLAEPPFPATLTLSGLEGTMENVFDEAPAGWPQCERGEKGLSISHNAKDGKHRIRWKANGCEAEARIEGDVRFTDDLTGIQSVSPGGYFSIEEDLGRTERKLEAENEGGRLVITYEVNGRAASFDAAGRAWLADMLQRLVRQTGFGAEQRVASLLRSGGVPAVLAEVRSIETDHVEGVYLRHLIASRAVTAAQLPEIMRTAGDVIQSDYGLATTLIAAAERHPLDAAGTAALLRAAGTVQSDYEHGRLLKAALAGGQVQGAQLNTLLRSAKEIGSDYELATLLIAAVKGRRLDADGRAAYLAALEGISSDYEMRRALEAFLDGQGTDAATRAFILDAAADIRSDYEAATLIRRIELPLRDRAEQAAFLRAVSRIDSDYELGRVLKAVNARDDLNEEAVATLLVAARTIQSDHELAELLVAVARAHRIEGALREAFERTAESLSSRHEQDRVAGALARSAR